MDVIKNKDCKPFTCMVQRVFITPKPCHFNRVEGLERHFFLIALIKDIYLLQNIKWWTNIPCTILMRDKYPLQNINGNENMIGL
jgi:hypothetical protein